MGNNLVCNGLLLRIPDDISETLFNMLDRVCTTFGARENLPPDSGLTDQNSFLYWGYTVFHPSICLSVRNTLVFPQYLEKATI